MFKSFHKWGIALLAAAALFSSCQEEDPPFLVMDRNAIVAPQETAKFTVVVESNTVWNVSSRSDWARVYGQEGSGFGSFDIIVDANSSISERNTEIVVSGSGCNAVIAIVQSSSELTLVTPVTDYFISSDAQDLGVDYLVSSDEASVKAFSNSDWLEVVSVANSKVSLSAAENKGSEIRDAEIKITGTGNTGKAVVNTIIVHQSATENTLDVLVDSLSIASMGETIKVPVQTNADISASSSSDWCSVAVAEKTVVISANENLSGAKRAAVITVSLATDKGKPLSKAINVSQESVSVGVSIPIEEYTVDNSAQEVLIKYMLSSQDFTMDGVSSAKWASVGQIADGIAHVNVEKNNTSSERTVEIALSATNPAGVTITAKTIIKQSEKDADTFEILVPEVNVKAEGETLKIPFNSSTPVKAKSSADWCQVSIDGQDIVLVVPKNIGEPREAFITLSAESGQTGTIKVSQSQCVDTLEIPVKEVVAKAEGETLRIPFVSSTADVTAKSSAYWCVVNVDGQDVLLTASKNVGPAREAFVTLTTDSGVSGTFKVTQAQSSDSIDLPVKEVSVKAEGGVIRIPYTEKSASTISSNVDWCSVTLEKGYVVAKVAASSDDIIREAYITCTTEDGNTGLIHILQAAKGKDTVEVLTPEIVAVSTASTVRIPFTSNAEVSARSSVEWMKVSVSGNDVVAKIEASNNERTREGYVTLTTGGGAVAVAHVTQDGVIEKVYTPYLNVVVDVLYAQKEGASLTIPYTSNSNVSAVPTADWLTATVDSNTKTVLVTVSENNTGKDRDAYVVIRNTDGLSYRVEIRQVSTTSLYALITEFTAGYKGETKTIPYKGEGNVTAETTEDWISASTDNYNNVIVVVAANDTDDDREGYVVLTDASGNTAYIHIYQNCDEKSPDEIKALVTTVYMTGYNNVINIPFTADNIEGDLEVKSSSDWLSGTIEDLDVVITAPENWSGNTRTGYLTITTPEGVVALITVIQTSLTPKFEFQTGEIVLDWTAGSASTLLVSTGAWELVDKSSVPAWLTLNQTSGNGDTVIGMTSSTNKFAAQRSATIFFKNTAHNMTASLKVTQEGNPNGLIEFLHLGKGYDVSGKYAEEAYVKAKVLDTDKLVAGDHIADLQNPNSTVEEVVTGSSLSEYEESYAATAGVSGSYRGFSASVDFNFSQTARGTSEYSFATLRHMTKKQILKIYDNETASDLKDCLSDMFLEDVANAVSKKSNSQAFTTAAQGLLSKYGTHVITGFALGGVLEYSMAADASSCETATDWGLAVTAGFEQEGIGSASASSSYQQYNNLKTQSTGFESKLFCRGGESQYASSGYGENAGKVSETYANWLTSLEDKGKWVLVDYEGSQLIELWQFVDDTDLKNELEKEAKKILVSDNHPVSGHKDLIIRLIGIETTHGDGSGDKKTEWTFHITSTVDNKPSTLRDIQNQTESQVDCQSSTEDIEHPENNKIIRNDPNPSGNYYDSGVYSLSKNTNHKVVLELTHCWEKDDHNWDKQDDNSLELNFEAGNDYWTYLGYRGSDKNQVHKVYDRSSDQTASEKEIVLWQGGKSDPNSGDWIRFILDISWK